MKYVMSLLVLLCLVACGFLARTGFTMNTVLQSNTETIQELQINLERTNSLISQYEKSQGELVAELNKVVKSVSEQDRLVQSIGLQLSQ